MRYALIMAGGSGTRLWPMSRARLPKQLIPLVQGKSLLRLAFERLEGLVPAEQRYVGAAEEHREAVLTALPELAADHFLGEPVGRDTLGAVGLGAAVLSRTDPEAVMGVFTADHLIQPADTFRQIVAQGFALVERHAHLLATFGITPSYPATGYGYLELGETLVPPARIVRKFHEKPPPDRAEQYVQQGPEHYLWNSGMFVWRAATLLECIRRYEPGAYEDLMAIARAWDGPERHEVLGRRFPALRKISVDYAVMEPASRDPLVRVAVLPMPLEWLDVGSWPSLAQTCPKDSAGNALAAERHVLWETSGCLVASSQSDHLIALIGCRDLVVIHTPDATLVCRADMAEKIREVHRAIQERFGTEYT